MNPDASWPLTVGEPNWAPLESALKREECADYVVLLLM